MARRRRTQRAHSGQLWARLYQLIKVEEPISFDDIRRLCRDVDLCDLDYTLREMCAARRISVARDWSGARFIETYCYGDGAAGVIIEAENKAASASVTFAARSERETSHAHSSKRDANQVQL